ncbi:hypothetical protein [Schleiferilactobacillus shenzhenensis]|uniref:hypothetical protein n=1 Tax=Schleiferilactobacillus shenzhenensis TaxID=1231337 RepID=UPI000418231A|nr:hypothetical protein [Schleiferilactobacillus shenzhenensis]
MTKRKSILTILYKTGVVLWCALTLTTAAQPGTVQAEGTGKSTVQFTVVQDKKPTPPHHDQTKPSSSIHKKQSGVFPQTNEVTTPLLVVIGFELVALTSMAGYQLWERRRAE